MTHQQQFDFEIKWDPISHNGMMERSEKTPHDRTYSGLESGVVSTNTVVNDNVPAMPSLDVQWARQQHHEPDFAPAYYNAISTVGGHRLNAVDDVTPTLMHVYDSLTAVSSLGTRLGSSGTTTLENYEQQHQQDHCHHPNNFSPHWPALNEDTTPLWGSPMQKQTQSYTATTDNERGYDFFKLDGPPNNAVPQAVEKAPNDAYPHDIGNSEYRFNTLKRRASSSGYSYAAGSDGGFPSESDAGAGSDNEQQQQQQRPSKPSRKRSKRESGERWNKRFTWPDDMHQKFIAAVFDVGFKHATPALILQQITANCLEQKKDLPPTVSTESVKQQLVRYQQVHERYRREISEENTATVKGSPTDSSLGALRTLSSLMTDEVLNSFSVHNALGLSSSSKPFPDQSSKFTRTMVEADRNKLLFEKYESDVVLEEIMFPNMTEEEKASPLGTSIGLVMALLVCVKDQLMNQRANSSNSNNDKINLHSLLMEASHQEATTSQRFTALSIQSGCKLLDSIQGCAQSLAVPVAHHELQHVTLYSYGQENNTHTNAITATAFGTASSKETNSTTHVMERIEHNQQRLHISLV
jgi:hypothetical protein